jgi:formylglycine-generating enzyme required for sulfatase activity
MANPDNSISKLDSDLWNRLDELASKLEHSWRKGPVDLKSILPDEADPLRPLALRELVKVDMELRWRKGESVNLDYYVDTYGELGPAKSLPASLIFEEYRVRQIFGDRPELKSYRSRFPGQFPDLEKIVREQPLPTMAPGGTTEAGSEAGAKGIVSSDRTQELNPPKPPPTKQERKPSLTGVVLKQMGGHRLISRLGAGAFGEVWKAEAPGGILKAVKVIFRPIDHEEARRELDSLELIKNLRHHFLLSTHTFLPIEDRLYILMDLADCSMRDRLKACKKEGLPGIPLLELIKLLREAAEALDYLQEKGVQHRDVKPENILICEGVVRVGDFGLARSQRTRNLDFESAAGTPVYMPPEAWQDKIHANSDQYSLAASYAECRFGKRVFDAEGLPKLMKAHLGQTPALEGFPEAEKTVLLKALAKDPEARYPSCIAFAEALEEAVAPQLPEGALKRFAKTKAGPRKLSNRDRAIIAGGFALFAVVLLGIGYLLWPRAGELEVANAPDAEIAVAETLPMQIVFNRNGGTEPIVLSVVEGTADVKIGEPVAESEVVTVPITVDRDASFGDRELKFLATSGAKTTDVTAKLRIVPLRSLPRPHETAGVYMPTPGTDLVDVGGKLHYRRIECRLGAPSNLKVRFRYVPWTERGKSSFYIMEDKVSNALYAEFARQNPAAVNGSRWRLGARKSDVPYPAAIPQTLALLFATLPGTPNFQAIEGTETKLQPQFIQPHWPQPGDFGAREPTWPVLRVDVQEAMKCAEWLGGMLPSVEQWDKASGRFEKNPGRGPFREGYKPGEIAINRGDKGPLPVGSASHDVSVFGIRDMAGNGWEWTRSLLRAGEMSEIMGARAVPLDSAVTLRGRDFSNEDPLDFASLEDGGLHIAFWQGVPDRVRSCPYESRIGFRVVLP